jgi:hypothetical protein
MFTNLPFNITEKSSSDSTVKAFNLYNDIPVEIDNQTLVAMTGFLETRGFALESAENIAIVIMIQSVRDQFNPMTVLETMKKLGENDLSQIIAEILNYNRLKTSVLGSVQQITPVELVKRNIVP